MGVDLTDRGNPDNYLVLSFWHWRPIVETIRSLKILPEPTVDNLHAPWCGFGIDADQAKAVASAIRSQILPELPEDQRLVLDDRMRLEPNPTSEPDDCVFHRPGPDAHNNYSTDRSVLEMFVAFCESSEGFTI